MNESMGISSEWMHKTHLDREFMHEATGDMLRLFSFYKPSPKQEALYVQNEPLM